MEDNHPENEHPNAKSPKKKASNHNKKWGLRRHWNAASKIKRLTWIASGVTVITGVCSLFVYVADHFQRGRLFGIEHRPRIIFSRPPQLREQVSCEITEKVLRTAVGKIDIWLKNIRNGDATNAFVTPGVLMAAEQKTGNPLLDNPESITPETCRRKGVPPKDFVLMTINSGQEIVIHANMLPGGISLDPSVRSIQLIPPQVPSPKNQVTGIPRNTSFQMLFPICAYYTDEEGVDHATCVTFRFMRKTGYGFTCDESPMTGELEAMFLGACEN